MAFELIMRPDLSAKLDGVTIERGTPGGGKGGRYVPPISYIEVVSITVLDMGGGDFSLQVELSEPVSGWHVTTTIPHWTFVDAVGVPAGLSISQPADTGGTFIEGFWNGTYTPPFTVTIPGGAEQVRGETGKLVRPGVYVSA